MRRINYLFHNHQGPLSNELTDTCTKQVHFFIQPETQIEYVMLYICHCKSFNISKPLNSKFTNIGR